MVLILKKGTDKSILDDFMKIKSTKKGFDAKAFSGKVKFKKDPLIIQKELRNEWG